jgi:zinc protease
MKKLFVLLVLFSFGVESAIAQRAVRRSAPPKPQPAQADSRKAIEIPFVNRTLPNGLEVIVLPDNAVPLVTVEMVVRNGSFTEPPELNGLSHLYEHMFFKTNRAIALFRCDLFTQFGRRDLFNGYGCESEMLFKDLVGDSSYVGELDGIGYTRNGTANEEHVNYYFTATKGNLWPLMRLMRDSMLFPSFDEAEFEREVQIVIAELDRQLSEPVYYLDRTLMDRMFFKYPSRKNPGGSRETVNTATTAKMRMIQERYYVPNNTALVVTGDVDPEVVFSMAKDLFSDWKRGEDPFVKFPLVEHPPIPKSEGVIVKQEFDSVMIQLGWHGPSIGKDDASTYAADVFSYIVDQSDSRLQRALVDTGLAVSVNVHYYTQRNVGPIRITMIASPDKAKEALKALHAEIEKFDDPDYYTDDELENSKTLLEAEDLYRREKLTDYTHVLGFWWASTGVDYFRGYHKNLRAVTRDDITRYVKTYIVGKPHIGVALVSERNLSVSKLTEADLVGGGK